MRRHLGWIAIVWLLALCALAVALYGGASGRASLDSRTQAVASGLRCLVCQGESVAESQSGLARSMRGVIRHQLAAGRSENQVRDYFVSKYGSTILLSPQSGGLGSLAWLAPPLLLLGGIGMLAVLVIDWRRSGRRRRVDAGVGAYLDRVRAEVAEGVGAE